jgi:hypothetical protein
MEQLLLYIMMFAIGYFVGVFRTVQYFVKNKKVDLDSIIDNDTDNDTIEEVDTDTRTLTVEYIGDTYYLYDIVTSEFICQGKSMNELMSLAKKYKDIRVAVVMFGNKMYVFQDGILKDTKNESQHI